MKYALKGKYPIETKDQLEKTANYFDRYLSRFHPKDRVEFASAIEKRANDLGVVIGNDWVRNYSRAFTTKAISPDFNHNMDLRKHACINKKISVDGKEVNACDLIDSIKLGVNDNGAYNTVDTLFAFDKIAGLEYQWDKSILDPIMTVFGSLNNSTFDSEVVVGNLTNYDLKKIASDYSNKQPGKTKGLDSYFTKQASDSFVSDPVGTVNKMSAMEKEAFLKIVE